MPVVVVTGASAGVGRATVRAFARRGASLALIARGRAGLEATAEEVEAEGGRVLVLPVDDTGYDSQQLPEPVDADRPDNLWEPIDGDHGAHGRFDQRALARSLQLTGRTAVGDLAAAVAGLARWGRESR